MTTALRIKCHIVRSFDECITLINQQQNQSLVIPLQPFFIDENPNILPLGYFFNDLLDPHLEFNLHQTLISNITQHAPVTMSKKSLNAIAADVFHEMQRFEDHRHAYPWLSNAVNDTQKSIEYQSFYDHINQVIERTTHWISTHYTRVIVFGVNPPYHQLLNVILNKLKDQTVIQWICPGPSNACMDNETVPQFLSTWSETLPSLNLSIPINQCQSLTQECTLGLFEAKKNTNIHQQVAIVSPNQIYTNELQRLSKLHGIHIECQQPIYLNKTPFGHLINLVIQWILSYDIHALRDICHHPLLSTLGLNPELTQWMNHIIDNDIYLKSNHQQINWIKKTLLSFNPHDILVRIIEANELNLVDIIHWFSSMFEYSNTSYLNYVSFEKIKALWQDAASSNNPLAYLLFKLESITYQPASSELILCISPEDMCKYPSHLTIVLGFGSESWPTSSNRSPYLAIETLNNQDYASTLRLSFAYWLTTSHRLISISYANNFNDAANYPLPFIQCNEHIIYDKTTDAAPFKRTASSLIKAPLPPSISPSNLELYQHCPSAYLFKVILKISPKKPLSEYQVFGNFFHQLIERIIDHNICTLDDVNQYILSEFNPAIAHLFLTKLRCGDWNINELISFIHTKDCSGLSSEPKLSTSMDGITIKGRADMVYETDTSIEVFDFKTGAPPTFSDISHFHYLQLGLYGLMLYQEQTNKTIRGRIISKKNTVSPFIDDLDSAKSIAWANYKPQLVSHVTQLLQSIKQNQFKPTDYVVSKPKHQDQCRRCDYYSICNSQERHQR